MTELLYNKSKAVAALNKVEGFNPLELARRISNEGEAEQLYLDVKYRKLWFRLLNPTGKIISNIISLTENMAVVEARVYLDKCDQKEECVGNSYAQRFRTADPKFGDKFLELAETAATGRALADAGYGVQFADVGEENDPLQVDAGIPVPPNLETPQPNGTMQMPVNSGQTPNNGMAANVAQNMGTGQVGAYTAAPDPSAAPPIQGSTPMMEQFYQNAQANGNTIGGMNGIPTLQNQALDPNLPAEELVNRMTYEQALSVTVTCGRLKNKTMGQVAMESPSSLGWYANEYSGKDHLMIAAARVILQRALPMAG